MSWNSLVDTSTGSAYLLPFRVLAADATGKYLYAIFTTASDTNVKYSADGGFNWTVSTGTPTTGVISDIYASANGQYVVVSYRVDDSTDSGGVYRSTDYGATFTLVSADHSYDYITSSDNGTIIYAGRSTGVSVDISQDGGNTWSSSSISAPTNDGICCSADGTIMYYTYAQVIYSTNNFGTNWSTVTSPPVSLVRTIACDATGQILVAGCATEGVYRSIDGGSTWAVTNAQFDAAQHYKYVACDAAGKVILAIDTTNNHPYLNADSGSKNWFDTSAYLTRSAVVTRNGVFAYSSNGTNVAYSPAISSGPDLSDFGYAALSTSTFLSLVCTTDGHLFAGFGSDGLMKYSNDYGVTFQNSSGLSGNLASAKSFAVDTNTYTYILVGFNDNTFYLSSDFGASFTQTSLSAATYYPNLITSSYDGSYAFVASNLEASNILVIQNAFSGSPSSAYVGSMSVKWTAIACSSSGQYVYAIGIDGVSFANVMYTSNNYGATWTLVPAFTVMASTVLTSITVDKNNGSQVVVGTDKEGLFISTDYGASWTGKHLLYNTNWSAVACDATGAIIMAGESTYSTIWTSTDSGATWTYLAMGGLSNVEFVGMDLTGVYRMFSDSSNTFINQFSSSASSPATLLSNHFLYNISSSANGQYLLAIVIEPVIANGFAVSTNGGNSWSYYNSPDAHNCFYTCMSQTGDYMYYNTDAKLYVSTDYGTSFTVAVDLTLDSPYMCVCDSTGQRVIVSIASGNKLFISTPSVPSYTQIPEISGALFLACSSTGQYIYAGLNTTLYCSTDYGATFTARTCPTIYNTYSAVRCDVTGQYVFLSSTGGIYRSSDYGATFTLLPFPSNNDCATYTVSPLSNRLVAFDYSNNLYYSSDKGSSWSTVSFPTGAVTNVGSGINDACGFSQDGRYYYVLFQNSGMYKYDIGSIDVNQWTVMYPYNFSCISSSTDGASIAAVMANSSRFYHSLDSGVSFHPCASLEFSLNSTNSIGMSSDGVTIIVNAYDGVMYISTDHGNTFSITGNGFAENMTNIVCSSNAQYVYALSTSHSNIWYSSDMGANWSLSGDFPYISWVSITCDSTGKNVYANGTDEFGNNIIFSSNTYGALWNINRDVIGGNTPTIYYPFENSVIDVMGGTPDVVGNPGFVSGVVGSYAVNLQNTFGSDATQYIRQAISLPTTPNFGISLWFNTQGVPTGQTVIFELGGTGEEAFTLCTSTNNRLYVQYQMPGATWGNQVVATSTSPNTWYHFSMIYNYNETCDIYLNNKLAVSFPVNFDLYVAPAMLSIGCYAYVLSSGAYVGYIDDFRFYNTRVIPNVAVPSIYYPFENSVIDVMGGTPDVVGNPGFVSGVVGSYALNLTNTSPGSYAEQYVRQAINLTTSPSFTITFRFNAQSLPSSYQTFLMEAGTTGAEVFSVTISTSGLLQFQYQVSTGWSSTTLSSSITLNTWYYVRINYAYNGNCYAYLDGAQTDTFPVDFTLYAPPNLLSIGAGVIDTRGAFTGYIDDFHMYNTAVPIYPSSAPFLTYMACDSTGQIVVVCGANYNMLYRSTDYGLTFSSINRPGSYYYNRIACDSTATKLLVSEISTNHVFYSEDTGATWVQQGMPSNNQPICVAMTPDATYLFSSQNYGRSYINAYSNTVVPWSHVAPLYIRVVYSTNNQYLIGVNGGNGNVVRSTDGGVTWVDATSYPTTSPNGLAMDYTGQYVVAIWSNNGIYRSTDYGDNFTQLMSAPVNYWNCITSNFNGSYIYAGVSDYTNGFIYLSSNSGAAFTPVDPAGGSQYWLWIKCSASGQYVYAYGLNGNSGSTSELYYSSNYGQTWTMITPFSSYSIQDMTCDGTGQYVLAACGTDGIYRSADYGMTWARTGAFYESPNGPYYNSIVCNGSGQQILAMDYDIGLVYRSTDSGATWAAQYLPDYYDYDGYSLAISPDGSRQMAELYGIGTFSTTSRADTIPTPSTPPVPCFLEGTKILCNINGQEQYVAVETIRPGTLVKTSRDGFKAVKLIGHRTMTNAGTANRDKNSLYVCSKSAYPDVTEDLTITGCHAILVDKITDVQRAGIINTMERIFVTDKKYRLPACIDERATVVQTAGDFTVWHFALEHHDIKMNYGVYAHGLLVESSPIWHMNIKNYTLRF
jgi:photosystem II stability/assembly factor-like uncharacterized protein